jgi:predicted lipoprotein with Yx(FWY)xxD motif
MRRPLVALAALAAVGALAAGCGSGSNTSSGGSSSGGTSSGGGAYGGGGTPSTSSGQAGVTTVATASSKLGSILVDGNGRTLYLFEKDQPNQSACSGGCAATWPPAHSSAAPKAGGGVTASMLGTIKRGDGSTQVTYNRHPLYFTLVTAGLASKTGRASAPSAPCGTSCPQPARRSQAPAPDQTSRVTTATLPLHCGAARSPFRPGG